MMSDGCIILQVSSDYDLDRFINSEIVHTYPNGRYLLDVIGTVELVHVISSKDVPGICQAIDIE